MAQRPCSLCGTLRPVVARSRLEVLCHACRRALRVERDALRREIAQVRRAVIAELRAAQRSARPATRQCGGCGQSFAPVADRQRFCGSACSARVRGTKAHGWPTARGRGRRYGPEHQAERRRRAAEHEPADPCVRCGEVLGPIGPHLHLDHDEHGGYLGFAHGPCNQRAAATKARDSRSK